MSSASVAVNVGRALVSITDLMLGIVVEANAQVAAPAYLPYGPNIPVITNTEKPSGALYEDLRKEHVGKGVKGRPLKITMMPGANHFVSELHLI